MVDCEWDECGGLWAFVSVDMNLSQTPKTVLRTDMMELTLILGSCSGLTLRRIPLEMNAGNFLIQY